MDEPGTDVCVVGGGPAGLTLALLLLRSGAAVTVVEKARSTDREYRGEILQPGGLRILDQLGVLAGARKRGGYELTRFQLIDGDRAVLDMDYRRLPAPHNHLLSIPQPHVLDELLDQCTRHAGFRYLAGHRVSALRRDSASGRVTGVFAEHNGTRTAVPARCVVGADGRYSKTRQLADIANDRHEVFDQDVLWFRLPAAGPPSGRVRIFRSGAEPLLAYDSFPDAVQIGWTVPHGRYREVTDGGVEQVRAAVARCLPEYAQAVRRHVRSWSDLTLLDVFGARARRWAVDGLLLIGDAAHTHSPLGAQGINLAIQDAAAAHPILVAALNDGDLGAQRLGEFERRRGRDIDAVMRFQVMQSKGMFAAGGIAGFLRPKVAGLLMHTPVGDRITRHVTLGNPDIRVHRDVRLVNQFATNR
ncbi:FAD-dependent monooxygenase [Plantactinospora sp. KBS50]|uniref:FAD-dependent monooxygenase n=1 Tax=Plantactinospora sp. KBS50 TaxID=2024580 RepID=UPI0018DEFE6F|nr:FAD-dependent monooxygenase [Plantactinospora sp. KBS50]